MVTTSLLGSHTEGRVERKTRRIDDDYALYTHTIQYTAHSPVDFIL